MKKISLDLSIISPVYNAKDIVGDLVFELCNAISKIPSIDTYEILLIDDGSSDESWKEIEKQVECSKHVRGVKFSRNFGQHQAITAGIERSLGRYLIIMDCDLQHNPEYLEILLKAAYAGHDIVYTRVMKRKHNSLKNLGAKAFNLIFNSLTGTSNLNSNGAVGSYSLISHQVAEAFLSVGDYQRHYLMILRWLGFKSTFIDIEHSPRASGKSSYTFIKLLRHALNGIVSQSNTLLYLSTYFGFLISLISFLVGIYLIVSYFLTGYQNGWTSLIVTIFFSTGVILLSLGVLGLYLGRTYEQTKNRPKFIIEKELNKKK